MKHFFDLWDYSTDEIMKMVEMTRMLKKADKKGACPKLLADASLSMIFAAPSTRTRVSFEVAMTKLGGHGLYLRPGELHLGDRETIKDTAKVLSGMTDAIIARVEDHKDIEELAKWAEVPVINGMTEYIHPTQALCDLVTIVENLPEGKELSDITLTFIGDTTLADCVATALSQLLPRFGATVIFASPKGYAANDDMGHKMDNLTDRAHEACELGGGRFIITNDPVEAVKDADYVYTGPWWYHGYEDEKTQELRRKVFSENYQVNMNLMKNAPEHVQFMHYMPALRDIEVTSDVMDWEQSLIFEEAENRLHTEKGILAWLVYPELKKKRASEALKLAEQARAEAYLDEFAC